MREPLAHPFARGRPVAGLLPRRGAALAMRGALKVALGLLAVALLAGPGATRALANPQKLDQYGGYFDERTGQYIYHHPPRDMALQKAKYLQWVHFPDTGTVKGTVAKVTSADTLWIQVGYRFAYQELAQHIAKDNKDGRTMLLRVDLSHISPRETAAHNPRILDWFLSKAAYELRQKLLGHKVTVNFTIVGGEVSRLRGMVFEGGDNVNLWMVLNGWSYYMLGEEKNPYDKLFRNAEALARRNKAGIWQQQQ